MLAGTLGWLLPYSNAASFGASAAETAAGLAEALADAQKQNKDQVRTLQLPATLPRPRLQCTKSFCPATAQAYAAYFFSGCNAAGRANNSACGGAGRGAPSKHAARVRAGCCHQGAPTERGVLFVQSSALDKTGHARRCGPTNTLPPQVGPGVLPAQVVLDQRILSSIKIDTRVTTRLTGENSLYQAYCDPLRKQGQYPLSMRAFSNLTLRFAPPKRETRKEVLSPASSVYEHLPPIWTCSRPTVTTAPRCTYCILAFSLCRPPP